MSTQIDPQTRRQVLDPEDGPWVVFVPEHAEAVGPFEEMRRANDFAIGLASTGMPAIIARLTSPDLIFE